MAAKSTGSSQPFDLDKLRELIELMEKHGLSEVNLRQGEEQWRLRRGPEEGAVPQAYPVGMPPMAYPPQAPAPQAAPAVAGGTPAPAEEAPKSNLVEIKSPIVGTFYAKPSPDEPDYVKVGSKVAGDTVVCLVEAMKVFNQIQAECSGTVEKILVEDGDAVDFGQVLFLVNPG